MVAVSAWPRWRLPVMLGGGSTMLKAGLVECGSARKYPRSIQIGYQRCSTSVGSYALGSSLAGVVM